MSLSDNIDDDYEDWKQVSAMFSPVVFDIILSTHFLY